MHCKSVKLPAHNPKCGTPTRAKDATPFTQNVHKPTTQKYHTSDGTMGTHPLPKMLTLLQWHNGHTPTTQNVDTPPMAQWAHTPTTQNADTPPMGTPSLAKKRHAFQQKTNVFGSAFSSLIKTQR